MKRVKLCRLVDGRIGLDGVPADAKVGDVMLDRCGREHTLGEHIGSDLWAATGIEPHPPVYRGVAIETDDGSRYEYSKIKHRDEQAAEAYGHARARDMGLRRGSYRVLLYRHVS